MINKYLFLCIYNIVACLLTSTDGLESILSGEIARPNQFPYQVSLMVRHTHICGGGIIANKYILTAAHCVINKSGTFKNQQITVLARTNNIYRISKPTVTARVKRVYVPKIFKRLPANTGGDIAVLQLKDSLGTWWRQNLKALKLPKKNHETYSSKQAIIAGFGWNSLKPHFDDEEGGTSDGLLRFAEVDVLSTKECQLGYKKEILETQVCGQVKKDNSHGVCTGDSGGPLVYDGKIVIGILSTSPVGCKEKTSAGIYTRVSDYLDFIENAIKDKSNDLRSNTLIP